MMTRLFITSQWSEFFNHNEKKCKFYPILQSCINMKKFCEPEKFNVAIGVGNKIIAVVIRSLEKTAILEKKNFL